MRTIENSSYSPPLDAEVQEIIPTLSTPILPTDRILFHRRSRRPARNSMGAREIETAASKDYIALYLSDPRVLLKPDLVAKTDSDTLVDYIASFIAKQPQTQFPNPKVEALIQSWCNKDGKKSKIRQRRIELLQTFSYHEPFFRDRPVLPQDQDIDEKTARIMATSFKREDLAGNLRYFEYQKLDKLADISAFRRSIHAFRIWTENNFSKMTEGKDNKNLKKRFVPFPDPILRILGPLIYKALEEGGDEVKVDAATVILLSELIDEFPDDVKDEDFVFTKKLLWYGMKGSENTRYKALIQYEKLLGKTNVQITKLIKEVIRRLPLDTWVPYWELTSIFSQDDKEHFTNHLLSRLDSIVSRGISVDSNVLGAICAGLYRMIGSLDPSIQKNILGEPEKVLKYLGMALDAYKKTRPLQEEDSSLRASLGGLMLIIVGAYHSDVIKENELFSGLEKICDDEHFPVKNFHKGSLESSLTSEQQIFTKLTRALETPPFQKADGFIRRNPKSPFGLH